MDWNSWVIIKILKGRELFNVFCNFIGIPELIVNSVSKADIDLRKTLYSEINLAGGTTMLSGFPERLLNEVRKLVAKELKVKKKENFLMVFGEFILLWLEFKIFRSKSMPHQTEITFAGLEDQF